MRLATLRSLLVILALLASLAVPAWPGLTRAQDDDAAYLAGVIGARDTVQPLGGPLSGSLVQQEAFATVDAANTITANFTAHVVFQNPDDDSAPWDFGFDFGRNGDASQRVMVDSTGVWRYAPYPDGASDSGPAPTLDTTPGSVNTLDLVVDVRRACSPSMASMPPRFRCLQPQNQTSSSPAASSGPRQSMAARFRSRTSPSGRCQILTPPLR